MTQPQTNNLSTGEAKLYDRQLRLWGVEAQQKLRTTDVLIAGMGCLGAEICKNIVLTGVRSVTLLDHRALTSLDIPGQFMAPFDAIGQNRATASVPRLSLLNPNVKISAVEKNLKDVDPQFFNQFKIVCIIGYPFEVLQQVDSICESKEVYFLAADSFGSFGYFFSNLGKDFNCHSETIVEEKDGSQTKKVDQHVVHFRKFSDCFRKGCISEAIGDVKSKLAKTGIDDVFVLAHLRVRSSSSEFVIHQFRKKDDCWYQLIIIIPTVSSLFIHSHLPNFSNILRDHLDNSISF